MLTREGDIMKTSSRLVLLFTTVLCAVLVATMCLALPNGVSFADETAQIESELIVGHMSDIHYFPLSECYRKVDDPDYEASDFFYSMTGDTKLVLESGMVLGKAVREMIEDAKAGIAPHYLFASGDLSKNGERVALIDVANALRYLQNEMRKIDGYHDFQVFATTGNHDLYNPDGAVYSQEDGSSHLTDVTSAMQFALIFAGLGYPDANLDGSDGAIKLTQYMPAEYWSSSFTSGYQASKNSESIALHYYNETLEATKTTADANERLELLYDLGDGINVLSFAAEVLTPAYKGYSFLVIDSSDRTEEKVGTIVALGKHEFEGYNDNDDSHIVFLENSIGDIDTSRKLYKKTDKSEIMNAFANGRRVFRATKYEHLTGGRITTDCLDWAKAYCSTQVGSNTTLGEETVLATFHQNALPHFEQEDDILKDFTLYNWEYTTKRLLDMGCRYVFTGHMHASDVMQYTDAEGRTLYDFETGSLISYASPRRYVKVERDNLSGKLGEIVTSSVHMTDDLKEVPSDNVFDLTTVWNQSAFDSATTLEQKLASNPNFEMYVRRYDMLSTLSYNDYSTIDIYSRLLDRVLDHFVNERLVGKLKGMVKGLLVGEDSILSNVAGGLFSSLGGTAYNAVEYLIDEIVYNLYENGYPYDGKTYDNAIDYLGAIVEKFVLKEFGDSSIASTVNPTNRGKVTIKDLVTFLSTAHAQGTEIKYCATDAELQAEYAYIDAHFKEVQANGTLAYKQPIDAVFRKRITAGFKELHEWAVSGGLVESLLDSLLQPLYYSDNSLLKTLIKHKFDFRQAIDTPKHDNPDEIYITESEYDSLEFLFETASNLLTGMMQEMTGKKYPDEYYIMTADNIVLDDVATEVMPVIKDLVASLIGFNLAGDTLTDAIDAALHGYITDSFCVGLGGIADNIIFAYATDVRSDYGEMTGAEPDFAKAYVLQPFDDFTYAGKPFTYVSAKVVELRSSVGAAFNPATQENGRVPSRLTSAFDVADPTTAYTVKFYTAEDVFANFKLQAEGGVWHTIGTEAEFRLGDMSHSSLTFDGIEIEMTTETKPQYVPLIDLGLACLTHGRVDYEDENGVDVPYVYPERDSASANSIIYWNVTTVTITGLKPATTYRYDVEGTYLTKDGDTLTFSLKDFSGAQDGFTMTTAKPKTDNSFEFLTIADIQGMIQGMYSNSFKAVEALLKDERTKNFDFVINAGDMADNGKNFNQWAMALDTYQPLFANHTQIFCAGNHEGNTYGMTNFFAYSTPKDEDGNELITDVLGGVYYSFDYANAHFVVLNTNDADTKGLGKTQFDWLKHDLETSNQKWKFVLMHKSLYSGGSHSYDGEVVAMRNQLVPLFAETGVSIVFAGHDHTYTSTMLIDKNGKATAKQDLKGLQYTGDGVLYITLGTMGTKFYEYGTNPDVTPKFDDSKSILHTLDSQTFGKVVVTNDKIEFTAYYYDRATNSIKVVGETELVDHPIFDRTIAIALIVVIPTIVVVSGVAILLVVLKMKGILGKK